MNRTKEELEARLRELENETESQEPEGRGELESLFAKPRKKDLTPYQSIFDRDFGKDLPPLPPRYVTAKDVVDNSVGFTIGQRKNSWSGDKYFQDAYPRPTYRNCGAQIGDLITNDLSLELARLEGEWYRASTELELCVKYTRQRLRYEQKIPGCPWLNRNIEHWEDSDEKRYLEQKWNFLLGLWQGLGMNPPDQKQLEAWARE